MMQKEIIGQKEIIIAQLYKILIGGNCIFRLSPENTDIGTNE